MNSSQTKDTPAKVIAMYESVIALIEEGRDIYTMKVEDITKKAGIGKGTAYEYFKMKEDIIINALLYDMSRQLAELNDIQRDKELFEDKIKSILRWLKDKFQNKMMTNQMFTFWTGSCELGKEIHNQFMDNHQGRKDYFAFIDELISAGKEQGLLHPMNMYQGRVAITSQIISFLMYLMMPGVYTEISEEDAIDVAYENMLRMLKIS